MEDVAGFIRELTERTQELTYISSDLLSAVEHATGAVHDLTDEVRKGLESLEHDLVGQTHVLESALADLLHELPSIARHASQSADDAYRTTRSEAEEAIHHLELVLSHELEQILGRVNDVFKNIRGIKEGIDESLETLSSVRQTTLALTSPLRTTSAAAGDALKIATQTFSQIG